ncbi:hypothetical protein ACFX5F_06170 [Flavobacterium sp. ZS1P70]|uniref:Uncharacterized protein n=1 Tax=Flavobacterium zhoui TaxID=3230414 RepID=A0ABW6I3E7_9FLAO
MNMHYHLGHLMDHFNSNEKKGQIGFHLRQIVHKYNDEKLTIDKSNEKILKKIISRMLKYDKGYWEKENWEYKILFYSLYGLLEPNRSDLHNR